jgi:PAS domain S-box-containing protein
VPSFETLIENSSDVIALMNAAGEVLYASASSAKVLGYLPEELVGRNTFDLIHPDDRGPSRRALLQILAERTGPRELEARVRQKNGQWCWVETTISNHLHEPRIAAIVINCREITARRAVRELKRRQTEDLARSNAELEDFAYAIAHDLKEPLRTISMFTDVLVKNTPLDAKGEELAHFIIDGVNRMSLLLEGLHTFAVRGFDDLPQELDLEQIVAEVLQSLGHAISASGAAVTLDPMPMVRGHRKHLLRVFQNLIVNAIKYHGNAPVRIRVSAERQGPDWIIRVQDNGVGIEPQYRERVFHLLKRLHGPEIPGAGIGLAICKKVIEAMGGTIWVDSQLGVGSTFCFTIAPAFKDVDDMKAVTGANTLRDHRHLDPLHAEMGRAASGD